MSKDPSHNDDSIREMFRAARRADANDAPDVRRLAVAPGSRTPLVRRPVWVGAALAVVLVAVVALAVLRPDWSGSTQAEGSAEYAARTAELQERLGLPSEEAPSTVTVRRYTMPPPSTGVSPADSAPGSVAPSSPTADTGSQKQADTVPADGYFALLGTPEPDTSSVSTLTQHDAPASAAVMARSAPTGDKGKLKVTVTDAEGNALPGATVRLHSRADGKQRAVVSGEDGVASLNAPSGEYDVETAFPSFATRREVGVEVAEGEESALDVRMNLERIARVQTATGQPIVQPEGVSTGFTDEFVTDLPVSGRFYQNALTLAPGATDADGTAIAEGSRSRDFAAQVSGVSNAEPVAPPPPPARRRPHPIPRELKKLARLQAPAGEVQGVAPRPEPLSTERYDPIQENEFERVTDAPLSTFSIDVDTASYSNLRRFIRQGQLPPAGAIRIEEWINYFDYDDPAPTGDDPFSVTTELGDCPWEPDHKLMRIGLKAREIQREEIPGTNLVFLIDVSGSMNSANKLPLLQKSLALLVDQLNGSDRVAIVVYAGSSGLVLPSSSDHAEIRDALERLHAGGSTNGGAGIDLAYRVARENFVPGGVNRVILATDGDFNVGQTDRETLLRRIKRDADEGVFLTALGFGMGNLNDSMLETLADKGNGNYAYIDSLQEAKKVLVEEIGGTLVTVAKDVKIQVEFNPNEVAGYRLIGYENRMLAAQDFNDDRKDAGEIGAGHSVTALYELIPAGLPVPRPGTDPLKYQTPAAPTRDEAAHDGEWLTVKLRYKEPEGKISRLIERPFKPDVARAPSADFDFAACVAAFGMALRDSDHAARITLDDVEELALRGRGADRHGYRQEFLELLREAKTLRGSR